MYSRGVSDWSVKWLTAAPTRSARFTKTPEPGRGGEQTWAAPARGSGEAGGGRGDGPRGPHSMSFTRWQISSVKSEHLALPPRSFVRLCGRESKGKRRSHGARARSGLLEHGDQASRLKWLKTGTDCPARSGTSAHLTLEAPLRVRLCPVPAHRADGPEGAEDGHARPDRDSPGSS